MLGCRQAPESGGWVVLGRRQASESGGWVVLGRRQASGSGGWVVLGRRQITKGGGPKGGILKLDLCVRSGGGMRKWDPEVGSERWVVLGAHTNDVLGPSPCMGPPFPVVYARWSLVFQSFYDIASVKDCFTSLNPLKPTLIKYFRRNSIVSRIRYSFC